MRSTSSEAPNQHGPAIKSHNQEYEHLMGTFKIGRQTTHTKLRNNLPVAAEAKPNIPRPNSRSSAIGSHSPTTQCSIGVTLVPRRTAKSSPSTGPVTTDIERQQRTEKPIPLSTVGLESGGDTEASIRVQSSLATKAAVGQTLSKYPTPEAKQETTAPIDAPTKPIHVEKASAVGSLINPDLVQTTEPKRSQPDSIPSITPSPNIAGILNQIQHQAAAEHNAIRTL
ncbi:hypothetical protein BDV06DRAFT_119382 [Aspergillus oleicola]